MHFPAKIQYHDGSYGVEVISTASCGKMIAHCPTEAARDAAYRLLNGECEVAPENGRETAKTRRGVAPPSEWPSESDGLEGSDVESLLRVLEEEIVDTYASAILAAVVLAGLEWSPVTGTCPVCFGRKPTVRHVNYDSRISEGHAEGCALDEALTALGCQDNAIRRVDREELAS